MFLVANGRLTGSGHNLRLVAIGKDMGQIVRHHVLGFSLDGWFGLQISVAGAVAENLPCAAEGCNH